MNEFVSGKERFKEFREAMLYQGLKPPLVYLTKEQMETRLPMIEKDRYKFKPMSVERENIIQVGANWKIVCTEKEEEEIMRFFYDRTNEFNT